MLIGQVYTLIAKTIERKHFMRIHRDLMQIHRDLMQRIQSKPLCRCARVTLWSAFTKAAVRSGSFFCCAISQIWPKLSVITLHQHSHPWHAVYMRRP